MGWLLIILAGLFEIGFTTSLKYSDNFTVFWPTVSFIVCAVMSFYLLSRAIKTIPLGTAYAVWTGIGAFGTALIGIVLFGEPASAPRLALLALLIGSIIGLKLIALNDQSETETAEPVQRQLV